jgi:hypothetical protein
VRRTCVASASRSFPIAKWNFMGTIIPGTIVPIQPGMLYYFPCDGVGGNMRLLFSTILVLGLLSGVASASTLCPDGTYVSGSQCTLAPNGKYVGGTAPPRIAPNGDYVSGTPRILPNGEYGGGRGATSVCPDGSMVIGTCHLNPNGTYTGG